MTEVGLMVLRALRAETLSIRAIAKRIGRCQRVTRGAVVGNCAAGLARQVPPTEDQQSWTYSITPEGLAALEEEEA